MFPRNKLSKALLSPVFANSTQVSPAGELQGGELKYLRIFYKAGLRGGWGGQGEGDEQEHWAWWGGAGRGGVVLDVSAPRIEEGKLLLC